MGFTQAGSRTPRIDLHIHTAASDGTDSPARAVELCRDLGLAAMAVTDHDTVAGVAEALEAGERLGIRVIPGMEVSTDYRDNNIHLLAYFLDIRDPALRPVLDWFYTLPIKPVQKFAAWLEKHAAKKRAAMNERNKKGVRGRLSPDAAELLALYLFVAIPLPGTGVWTGSAIATLFEMPRGKAAAVILLGNATACLITTLMRTGAAAVL